MSKNQSTDSKTKVPKSGNQIMASTPLLDHSNHYMLNGKKDRVKGLISINVRFYPGSQCEITYEVDRDGNGSTEMLSVSTFQAMIRQRKLESGEEFGDKLAKGFVRKLQKRLLINVPETQEIDENWMRTIQASKMPRPAKQLLELTQKETAEKGLSTNDDIIRYMVRLPKTAQDLMDGFQVVVDPTAKPNAWSSNVASLNLDLIARVEAAAAKKAARDASAKMVTEKKQVLHQRLLEESDDDEEEEPKAPPPSILKKKEDKEPEVTKEKDEKVL